MSTPISNPTRQQLEELDSLLQRMLTLPGTAESDPLPPAVAARMPAAPPPMPAAPPVAPAPPPRRRAEPPSGENAWNVPLPTNSGPPVLNTWPAGVESLTSAAASNVQPRPLPPAPPAPRMRATASAPVADPPQRFRLDPAPPPTPVSMEAPLPFYLWPMGAIDRMLGSLFLPLGAPGRWLGCGSGKIVFGWCGLAMITAAVVWGIVDYLGWTW